MSNRILETRRGREAVGVKGGRGRLNGTGSKGASLRVEVGTGKMEEGRQARG